MALAVCYACQSRHQGLRYIHAPTRGTGVVEALPLSSESAKRLLMKLSSTDSTMQASESFPARLSSYTYPLDQAHLPFSFLPGNAEGRPPTLVRLLRH
jgi:hypothetical protein